MFAYVIWSIYNIIQHVLVKVGDLDVFHYPSMMFSSFVFIRIARWLAFCKLEKMFNLTRLVFQYDITHGSLLLVVLCVIHCVRNFLDESFALLGFMNMVCPLSSFQTLLSLSSISEHCLPSVLRTVLDWYNKQVWLTLVFSRTNFFFLLDTNVHQLQLACLFSLRIGSGGTYGPVFTKPLSLTFESFLLEICRSST